MAKEVQNSRSGEIKKTAEDLDEFLSKVSHCYNCPCLVYFIYLLITTYMTCYDDLG